MVEVHQDQIVVVMILGVMDPLVMIVELCSQIVMNVVVKQLVVITPRVVVVLYVIVRWRTDVNNVHPV